MIEGNNVSTYYYFGCKKCQSRGGFFSRQMWGWGNADIIDSFQFIMKHSDYCGEENIYILSEHDDYLDSLKEDKSEELMKYFPCSDDWDEEVREKKFKMAKDNLKHIVIHL